MKLAVCIPVYNFDIRSTVLTLKRQLLSINETVELIIIDDASQEDCKIINRQISEQCKYIELPKNIGRSKIRNLFLQYSEAEYFLFLDGDSLIHRSNFIQNYLDHLSGQLVICGGRDYGDKPSNQNQLLRWRYGVEKEMKTVNKRNLYPNDHFMTNNFVVKRALLEATPFNESLKQYGHEDTLFGLELKAKNITIKHIDNPILNGQLEPNDVYLLQSQQALENLTQLLKEPKLKDNLLENVQILRFYQKSKNIHFLLKILYRLLKTRLEKRIFNGTISMKWFDFYRLGFLIYQIKN